LKPVVPTFQGRPEGKDLNWNLRVSNWTRFSESTQLYFRSASKIFGTVCTPENPMGSCMVSPEGSCAAYYLYGRWRDA
jgi:hypothetical protein